MESYVVLLRGINVGGHRKIKMKDLKQVLEEYGFLNVQTYIQSGNVVLQSNFLLKSELIDQIQNCIERTFEFEVPVFIYTQKDWTFIIENNPFIKDDTNKCYTIFCNDQIDPAIILEKGKIQAGEDRFEIRKNVVYLYLQNGYSKTKLTHTFFEKHLNQEATARNWKTVLKLQEKVNEL